MPDQPEYEIMPDSFWTAIAWAGGAIIGLSGAAVAIHARVVRSIETRAIERHVNKAQSERIAELESVRLEDHRTLLSIMGKVEALRDQCARIEKQVEAMNKRAR